MANLHTLSERPVFAFCPTYEPAGAQLIRIVFAGVPGYAPTAFVALTLEDADRLCDRLNARLGLDHQAWTALVEHSRRSNAGWNDVNCLKSCIEKPHSFAPIHSTCLHSTGRPTCSCRQCGNSLVRSATESGGDGSTFSPSLMVHPKVTTKISIHVERRQKPFLKAW